MLPFREIDINKPIDAMTASGLPQARFEIVRVTVEDHVGTGLHGTLSVPVVATTTVSIGGVT